MANVFFALVYARCLAGTIPEYGTRLELMCTNPLYVRMPEFEHSGVRLGLISTVSWVRSLILPEEERLFRGMSVGSFSRTAAGNRA